MESTETRILICDDSELIFAGLKFTIEKIPGYIVVGHATNGQEAVQMASELSPHTVLMDVAMPVMDGLEATVKIKEQFPSIQILMLTGTEDEQIVRQSLHAGADGFCLKNVHNQQLISAVQSVSCGAVWLAPSVARKLKSCWATTLATEKLTQRNNFQQLTRREHEVLALIAEGLCNSEIADRLCLSYETVKSHVRHIYEKLAVRHRTEAVVEAIKRGILPAA